MKGCTFDEFKQVVKSGWEITFTVRGTDFYYERLTVGNTSTAHMSHLEDKNPFFNKHFNDDDTLLEEVLALPILGDQTLVDLQDEIEVNRMVK